jgi:hypothetical protein
VWQTVPGFDLDRDSIVQGTNHRDSEFRVHFIEPLRVQGSKWTFSNIRGRDIKRKKELNQELADLEAIEETMILSFDQSKRKSKIQEELMLIYENEEAFWSQRSREQWLLKGDNNTEFFHRCANGQKRKRTIFSLQNGSVSVQGTPDLLAHATSFYKELFGPQQMSLARLRNDSWFDSECLNEMDLPFSEKEVKDVIDQMEKNKAAGPDGFPIEFYQVFWEIIKSDLMQIFDDFYHHRIDFRKINYGVITLIPKGENANIIQKYRPICLLQVLFKIFTKTLTVRSEPYMLKIIHHCQTTFIRG